MKTLFKYITNTWGKYEKIVQLVGSGMACSL